MQIKSGYTSNAAAHVDNMRDEYWPYGEPPTGGSSGSKPDAEIDRVKRRLKKLAKRARKMGIDLEFSDLRDAA